MEGGRVNGWNSGRGKGGRVTDGKERRSKGLNDGRVEEWQDGK